MRNRQKTDTKRSSLLHCCCCSQPTYIFMMKYVLFIQIRSQIECEWKRVKERTKRKKVHKMFSMLLLKLPYRSLYPLLPSNCNSLTDVVSAPFLLRLSLSLCVRVLFFFSSLHTYIEALAPCMCVCIGLCWHNALAPYFSFRLPARVYHLKFASFAIE